MKKLTSRIQEQLEQLKLQYSIVDLEGNTVHSTNNPATAYSIDELLTNTSIEVLPLKRKALLLGYVVIHQKLKPIELQLLESNIGLIQQALESDEEKKLEYTQEAFWKSFLYKRTTKQSELLYKEQFGIEPNNLYILFFVKTVPPEKLTSDQCSSVAKTLTDELGLSLGRTYSVQIRPGELVVIIEQDESLLEKSYRTIRTLRQRSDQVVYRLHKKCIDRKTEVIIGGTNPVQLFSDIPDTFFTLKDFIRSAAKLFTKSRVILYEHIPLYSLIQHITPKEAQEYVDTVLKEAKNSKEMLESSQTLFESSLNVAQASKSLHIHRNTLEYRIEKMKGTTQLNPLKFFDAIQIHLAIILKDLYSLD